MKQFRKWILNDECPVLSSYEEMQREKGWRAAFERTLKYVKRSERGSIGIIDWLEKELQE